MRTVPYKHHPLNGIPSSSSASMCAIPLSEQWRGQQGYQLTTMYYKQQWEKQFQSLLLTSTSNVKSSRNTGPFYAINPR